MIHSVVEKWHKQSRDYWNLFREQLAVTLPIEAISVSLLRDGPGNGHPEMHSSFRSELGGILSVLYGDVVIANGTSVATPHISVCFLLIDVKLMELSLAPRMIIVILYLFMQVLFHLQ
jgi:hypothetical protein